MMMTTPKDQPKLGKADAAYDVKHLLDVLIEKLKLKNDAALSRALGVTPPIISKIRHGKMPLGATLLIAMHEESGLSVKELRQLMGDTNERFYQSSPERPEVEPR